MATENAGAKAQMLPVREDLFTRPLSPLSEVRLAGTECDTCGEVSLGKVASCPNCIGQAVHEIKLSRRGRVWTYTIIRHRPPGDYKGPEPFVPFGVGLVELPEGIRVLSPIDSPVDQIKIGMAVDLDVYKLFTDEKGDDVIAFRFRRQE